MSWVSHALEKGKHWKTTKSKKPACSLLFLSSTQKDNQTTQNTTDLGASKGPPQALPPASAPARCRRSRRPLHCRSALPRPGAECCWTCRSRAEQTGANRLCLAWRSCWRHGDCCSRRRSSVDSGPRASMGDSQAVACSHSACGSYPPTSRKIGRAHV